MEWQIPFMCLTEEQTSIYFYSRSVLVDTHKKEKDVKQKQISKGEKSHWKSIKKTFIFSFQSLFSLYFFLQLLPKLSFLKNVLYIKQHSVFWSINQFSSVSLDIFLPFLSSTMFNTTCRNCDSSSRNLHQRNGS